MAHAIPKFRYLSAWFCPYAHRATLALEHHAGAIEYEWVEALGWEQRKGRLEVHLRASHLRTQANGFNCSLDEKNVTGTGKEWWYHWKVSLSANGPPVAFAALNPWSRQAPELIRANPSGLVPTLIPIEDGKVLEERSVYESLITIDFVDSVANSLDEQRRLVPSDPYIASKCRYWAEKVNRECCSPYYGVLVKTDEEGQKESFDQLVSGLKAFSRELEKNGDARGFLGGGRLTNTDFSLAPWAYRYYIFENYRGYGIPKDDDELAAYHVWHDHIFSVESVKRTLPDKERYLEHIGKYADSSARSKVANAVRRGVSAHEIDDEKDTY